jgi:probable phosphoglycerate mutase
MSAPRVIGVPMPGHAAVVAPPNDEEKHVLVRRAILIRHGETAWTLTGQHTSVTDLPLTEHGRETARELAPLAAKTRFALVLTSPMRRARETCALAGLGDRAQIEPDLIEWNYGEYEGLTAKEIDERQPGWMLFADGCPGGEAPADVAARADRVIARIRGIEGDVALFAHGHIFRVFVARWLGLPPDAGSHFLLDPATVSVLSHYRGIPAVKGWNAPLTLNASEGLE